MCVCLQMCVSDNEYIGWLRLVGSLTLWVSFAKEPYKRDYILQKRRIIIRRILIVATPYNQMQMGWHRILRSFQNFAGVPAFCPWDLRFVPSNKTIRIINPMRIQVRLIRKIQVFRNNLKIMCHFKAKASAHTHMCDMTDSYV